jgi:hypothetical protein
MNALPGNVKVPSFLCASVFSPISDCFVKEEEEDAIKRLLSFLKV